MADTQPQAEQPTAMGPGGVPLDAQTSDYYRTKNIPARFDNPGPVYNMGNPVFTSPALANPPQPQMENQSNEWFQGYNSKPTPPMYRTSNSDYGARAPSVHTMPCTFHAKSQGFTEDLGKCGMFRNHSLNCSMDKSVVPDH